MSTTPDSWAMTCWVRSASLAARSVGRPRASSKLLVCRLWVPPSTAARAWVATRTLAERRQINARYNYDPRPADYAGNARDFPYTYGRDFVRQLVATGGNAAVDAAFGNPPVSTAQILNPRLYGAGTLPVTVRPPQAEGQVVDAGTLGRSGRGWPHR